MHHIVVMPPVSKALGAIFPDREALLLVLTRLYDQLTTNAARWRTRRNPHDPDLFDYVLHIVDPQDRWLTLRFSVDDRQATDHLIVVAVSHRTGKVGF